MLSYEVRAIRELSKCFFFVRERELSKCFFLGEGGGGAKLYQRMFFCWGRGTKMGLGRPKWGKNYQRFFFFVGGGLAKIAKIEGPKSYGK